MANILADLKNWSATAASNQPDSTDTATIQADLQQLQATVRQDLATKGADIASASTTDLGAVAGLMHDITGTTTITAFGTVAAGIWKLIKFEGALTLTHNSTSLILPGGANITTANGDAAIVMSEGSGNWRCLAYQQTKTPGTETTQAAADNSTKIATTAYVDRVALTQGTSQASTSGTSIDFTSIPAGVKLINISLSGVSTNGTSLPMVQLGDAGGPEGSGYVGGVLAVQNSGSGIYAGSTAGFLLNPNGSASAVNHGIVTLVLVDAATFSWVASYSGSDSTVGLGITGGGSKSLSAELDRVRITTVNGTDAFDAGLINIQYQR